MNYVLVAIPCWSKKETGNPFEAVGFRYMDPKIKFMNSTTTDGYSYIKENHIKKHNYYSGYNNNTNKRKSLIGDHITYTNAIFTDKNTIMKKKKTIFTICCSYK